jgi:signal transduction histidine kinase
MLNAGGALLAFGMAVGADAPAWPRLARTMVMSLVYTNCVGTIAALALPPVIRRYGRGRAAGFAVRLAGIVVAIGAGMALAAVILLVIGVIDSRDFVRHAMPTDWPIYVYPTMLLVSLGVSYYLTMSEELADATIALRTKERDEAVARQQAAEAHLAALEARVQPHFLFNSLNSIAALIPEDAEGAERMVERVSALLRSSLQDGPSTTSLGDELRVVRDYLEIERVRFRDRLRYELQVAPEMERIAVPRLSVQTLVENAVKYAVALQRGGATIVIAASATDDRALVSVSDDGPGFSPNEEGQTGLGLRLLRARLKTLFGDRASLRIDSRPGATSCVIEVPVQ